MRKEWIHRSTFIACGFLLISQLLVAHDPDQYSKMSLEDLLKLKVITVSKRAEAVRDAPGIISVVSHDEIERFGGTTLADILSRVPGLIHVSGQNDATIMAARGDSVRHISTNRHVLLLIDGRPVREVMAGGVKTEMYNAFPVNVIDHIEVIKGPGSVLYGSEAYSAVINVVTSETESIGASVAGATGTESSSLVLGRADIRRGDFSMMVAARAAKLGDRTIEYAFGAGSTYIMDSYDFKDRAKGIFLKSKYRDFQLTGSYLDYDVSYLIPQLVSSFDDANFRKLFLDASYSRDISEDWNLAAHVTYNQNWYDAYAKRESTELLGEITNIISISDKVRLTFGGLIGTIDGTNETLEGLMIAEGSRDNWAVYGQVDYQFVDTAKLTAGFQALKYENIDLSVVPRFGLVWNPSQRFNVKALYAEAFRAPYLIENFQDYPGIIIGNPNLKPEIVKSYELGLSYIEDQIEMSICYFNNRQSDTITYGPRPDQDQSGYLYGVFNIGGVKIHGFEFETKYYVNRSLFLTGSLLSQSVADNELSGFSDFGAKAGISYSSKIGAISLFNIYQGSVSERLYDPSSPNPEPGPYNLLYLHANLDIKKLWNREDEYPKLMIFVQGDNLLDEEIWLPSSGGALPASLPYRRGRDVYVGFELTF